ncbi:MAG: hypothetical protein AAF399_02290 [Bacteroidota bacterium]
MKHSCTQTLLIGLLIACSNWYTVCLAQSSPEVMPNSSERFQSRFAQSQDTYFSLVFGLGNRRLTQPGYDISLTFLDESPIPDPYVQDIVLAPQNRVRTFDWGVEYGKYEFLHLEVLGSFSYGEVRSSAFAVGLGLNRPMLQHRLILRGVLGLNWARYHFEANDFPLNPNSLNATINGIEFFSPMEVRVQRRMLEVKPRAELLFRLPMDAFVKAAVGLTVPTVGGNGKLVFSGEGIDGTDQSTKVNLNDEAVTFSALEAEVNSSFPPTTGIGPFFSLGIGINFFGTQYYR